MIATLPILDWEEVWNDVGRQFKTVAGTAYMIWVNAPRPYTVNYCVYLASKARQTKDLEWIKRHVSLEQSHDAHRDEDNSLELAYHKAEWIVNQVHQKYRHGTRQRQVFDQLVKGVNVSEAGRRAGMSKQMAHHYVRSVRKYLSRRIKSWV